eukprot:CAMPEP_0172502474 /NCGR_PEP_ID=MMETSP1066-20121228/160330_1 /TAXON_ID=671091 /ORGANISM="Coscinodiscus wailesii, Strain CCMP2513" /LENGTH=52 /DNA_ID=CAMNT_0013277737 /DNA_START=79 /DNA_END=234 /DNA_ORIENTATION=+
MEVVVEGTEEEVLAVGGWSVGEGEEVVEPLVDLGGVCGVVGSGVVEGGGIGA